VLPLIRHHHERWDGSGYPDGLRETEIPLLARVVQVVDIYDALTHPRPYKHAYSSARALEILEEEAERGWRDKEITRLFVRMHRNMLAKIGERSAGEGGGLASISDSLRSLQSHLAH
jgi:putative two-component system response regulator